MKTAPILLFAYNRPEHTKRLLESLMQNKESQESDLFVFIDGLRSKDDVEKIDLVKKIVESHLWCRTVTLKCNIKNQGVPAQVIPAVTQFCQEREKVIVLEDDLILSPFFLNFINKALDVYAEEERVMEVSGYMFPIKKVNVDSGFVRGSWGWGWGTWQRAWQYFEVDGAKLLAQMRNKKKQYEFNLHGSCKNFQMLVDQVAGKIGGWDIRWAASIFLRDGFTFLPSQSLVQNIGLDGSGANIPNSNAYETQVRKSCIEYFPEDIIESEEMLSAVIKFYKEQRTPMSLVSKLVQRIQKGKIF